MQVRRRGLIFTVAVGTIKSIKMVAGLEQTKFRGCDRVGWAFSFAATAYNLTRLPKLLAASA